VSTQNLAMTDVSRKNLIDVSKKNHWSTLTKKTWTTTTKKYPWPALVKNSHD